MVEIVNRGGCYYHGEKNYKHKLALLLISFTIVICTWLFLSGNVYAASATVNRNGYLYVPKSAGCPQFPTLYVRRTTEYDYTDDDGSMHYWTYYDGVTTTPYNSYSTSYQDSGLKAILWYSGYSAHYGSYGTDNDFKDPYSVYLVIDPNAVIDGNNLRFRILGQIKSGKYENYWASPGYQIASVGWYSQRDTSSSFYSSYEPIPYSVSVPTNSSHSFTTTANATCTTAAVQKCSSCGLSQSVGNPLGHAWNDWIILKDATVYEAGSKKHICSRNNSHVETVTIPQMHFQIYSGASQINKIYLGSTLIMNANAGTDTLVK